MYRVVTTKNAYALFRSASAISSFIRRGEGKGFISCCVRRTIHFGVVDLGPDCVVVVVNLLCSDLNVDVHCYLSLATVFIEAIHGHEVTLISVWSFMSRTNQPTSLGVAAGVTSLWELLS